MKNLVQQVAAGRHSFEPEDNSASALQIFQRVVALLLEAESLGYVDKVQPHEDSDSGPDFYDTVFVGAVTDLGREFIS